MRIFVLHNHPAVTSIQNSPRPGARQPAAKPRLLAAAVWLVAALSLALAGCAPAAGAQAAPPAVIPVAGDAPALEVNEFPLVEQSQDNPTHLGFQEHVVRAVLEQRQALDFPRSDDRIAAQNRALAPFGFRLEASESPPFSGFTLYYQGRPLRSDIARFWPVSVKNGPAGQASDFLLPFLTLDGEKLVASAAGVRPWPGHARGNSAPAYYGEQIAYAEIQGGMLSVYAGQSLLYSSADPTPAEEGDGAPDGTAAALSTAADPAASTAAHGLYTWDAGGSRHWALDLGDNLIIDGQDMNEKHQSEQVFEFRLVDERPMYFYVKNGITYLHYAGSDLPYVYDQVVRENEGELQVFNPGAAGDLVWFYALRDGLWYYVEAMVVE